MEPPTESEERSISKSLLCESASRQLKQHTAYLQHYHNVICPSSSDETVICIDNPVFKTHDNVLSLIGRLINDPSQTRHQFTNCLSSPSVFESDKDAAVRDLVRLTFMFDCFSKQSHPEGFEVGDFIPSTWQDDEQFADFATRCFPAPKALQQPQLDRIRNVQAQKKRLKAWKLKKRYKIKLDLTDNITEHLLYNSEQRSVKIFHHTGFLKAHLRRSLSEPIDLDFQQSLKLGTLPPQLLLETLDSIQYILFPISTDSKSEKLLNKLIDQGFDPNAHLIEGRIRDLPERFTYKYWGGRLLRLRDTIDNPPPANRIIAWCGRHTSERNALTVAILGLILAVIFGFLGLLVGIAQLVFSILQYKIALLALKEGSTKG